MSCAKPFPRRASDRRRKQQLARNQGQEPRRAWPGTKTSLAVLKARRAHASAKKHLATQMVFDSQTRSLEKKRENDLRLSESKQNSTNQLNLFRAAASKPRNRSGDARHAPSFHNSALPIRCPGPNSLTLSCWGCPQPHSSKGKQLATVEMQPQGKPK